MKFTYLIGALIIALMMVAPVAAVNEYRDMNPANDVVDPSIYGYAQFFIRAGGSAQDLNIYVQNAQQNLSFDSRWNPDRTDIPEQNGNWMLVEVLPDGMSEKVLLASGQDYQACLRNGNGNQVECQNFIVGGADITRVAFLGAAVGCGGDEQSVCQREIVSAKYGKLVEDAWIKYDDVTDEVRKVVSLGHLSFVFSNGWLRNYEGGIFDNPTDRKLLLSIGDPAKNIQKTVTITYKDCSGVEHTITEDEYDIITLT